MKRIRLSLALFAASFIQIQAFAQAYTSYFTGNPTDVLTQPFGGACIMGGATEHDEAMKRFLVNCNGGDVLVLRASGADGYNAYLYSQLGIPINSVETIVCNNATASFDPYLHQKIQQAEGIWFAGGDQWNYVSYWRNTPIDSLVREAIDVRNAVVGGTSAGMAILGQYYFSAQNGTVQSSTALANPFDSNVTVDSARFIQAPFLERVITDTHYDSPDRKGRHVVFLARIAQSYGLPARGIACDEYTAVFIDSSGIAHVYGDAPNNDDFAYFIQTNCELSTPGPELCQNGVPLTWSRDSVALRVYVINGTQTGSRYFNLNDWKTGGGGLWRAWYVVNGVLNDAPGTVPGICDTTTALAGPFHNKGLMLYPQPVAGNRVHVMGLPSDCTQIQLTDALGRSFYFPVQDGVQEMEISLAGMGAGMYTVVAHAGGGTRFGRLTLLRHH